MNKEDKNIRMLVRQKRDTDKSTRAKITEEDRKEQIKRWTQFYRKNIDMYVEQRLRIKLRPFQRIMLHLLGRSQVWFGVCSRASSKSFVIAIYAVSRALLFPYTPIIITSSTLDQAKKMVDRKIKNELIDKLSPVLKYMYDNDMIIIQSSKDSVQVKFFNGSTIDVYPPVDAARGSRGCVLIYEECRLLKKTDVDSIFEPMLSPRQPMYLQKDEYASDKDYYEDGISIYITSSRYKTEWWYRLFKKTVEECFVNTRVIYNFFATDIFTSLKYGLKTENEWLKIKKNNNDLD